MGKHKKNKGYSPATLAIIARSGKQPDEWTDWKGVFETPEGIRNDKVSMPNEDEARRELRAEADFYGWKLLDVKPIDKFEAARIWYEKFLKGEPHVG